MLSEILEQRIYDENLILCEKAFHQIEAVLVDNIIYLNSNIKNSQKNRLIIHEFSHANTCPFNLIAAPKSTQDKYEAVATRDTVFECVPIDKLIHLCKCGLTYAYEFAEEWKEEHFKTLTARSQVSCNAPYERVVSKFGDTFIKKITIVDIHNFIIDFSKNRASKTVSAQLSVVSLIFSYAVLHRDIEVNFIRDIKIHRNLRHTIREAPSSDIIKKIKNSNHEFKLFALTALYAGCRRGEILALQWKDIDFNTKKIRIEKSMFYVNSACHIKPPKTQSGIRTIDLLKPLEIELLQVKGKPEEYIFTYKNMLIKGHKFENSWKSFCINAGINITPHQLRHYYATRLYELGIDIKSAQGLLGHADFSTTQNIYTHLSEQKQTENAIILENFKNLY